LDQLSFGDQLAFASAVPMTADFHAGRIFSAAICVTFIGPPVVWMM
jgi:hypothetical protein